MNERKQSYPIFELGEKEVIIGRSDWPHVEDQQYAKGCKWSPDGTCLLAVVRCAGMHIFELPTDLYPVDKMDANRALSTLTPAVSIEENGLIYDFTWYPGMTSASASTCWYCLEFVFK